MKRLLLRLAALSLVLSAAACSSGRDYRRSGDYDQYFDEDSDKRGSGAPQGVKETQLAPAAPVSSALASKPPPQYDPSTKAFDPKAYAALFPSPAECEQNARALQKQFPDQAWETLKICVARKEFTLIKRISEGGWDKFLQTRRDAAQLLARLIANRGGDVDGDLASMRELKIPLFSLTAAMEHPQVYKGRLVLVRARVDELKTKGGKSVVSLAEIAIGAGATQEVQDGGAVKLGVFGKFSKTRMVNENQASETGRMVLGSLAKPDPFLSPDKQFLVLGRFDGVRVADDAEGDEDDPDVAKVAMLRVIDYWAPHSLVIE